MSRLITAKQSLKARSLLKWNPHDVVSKCNVPLPRLERFERSSIHLTRPENESLKQLYMQHGVEFTHDFDVKLKSEKSQSSGYQNIVYTLNGEERPDENRPPAEDSEQEGKGESWVSNPARLHIHRPKTSS